jgi:DNA-binding transcriptional LysR family regulator
MPGILGDRTREGKHFLGPDRERHPRLRLHVRQQSTRPLLDEVRAGRLDVAVGLCVQDPAGLATQRLKDEPVFLALAGEVTREERWT